MSRPSLDKTVEITDPAGNSYRWGAGARDPRDVPLSIRFSTRQGKGFDACSLSLSRRLDVEYPDLALEHEVRVIGAQGQVLWEGFTSGTPRERTMDGDSINLESLGWWDDAGRQEFVELLIDRDLDRWGEPPLWWRTGLSAANIILSGSASMSDGGVLHQHTRLATNAAGPYDSVVSWYDAPPGAEIAGLLYSCTAVAGVAPSADWDNVASLIGPSTDTVDHNGNTAVGQQLVATGPRAASALHLLYKGTYTGDGDWSVRWHQLAVVGSHGLTLRERSDGGATGLHVSDMLRYLWGKYYPRVDLSGVEQSTYPVPHAVWHDPVRLPDASLELNRWHGWRIGMWEGRRLEFAPHDFSSADWQVRAGQDGVEVQAAGDSTEAIWNGATVSWTDFSGQGHFLSARTVPELRDTSPWIPANQWDKEAYLPVNLSGQMEQADAIALTALHLASANRAKRPSVITVPYYIRNGAGDWRPVGEVRAGQTIAVTNLVGDAPRLITATDVDGDRLVISTDDAIADLETYLYRLDVQTGIGAPR